MYAKHLSSVSNCFVTSMSFISLPSHEPRNQHYADKKDNQEQNAVFLLHGRQATPKSYLCQVHNHRCGLFALFGSLLAASVLCFHHFTDSFAKTGGVPLTAKILADSALEN